MKKPYYHTAPLILKYLLTVAFLDLDILFLFSDLIEGSIPVYITTPFLTHYWLMSRESSIFIGSLMSTLQPVSKLCQGAHSPVESTGSCARLNTTCLNYLKNREWSNFLEFSFDNLIV